MRPACRHQTNTDWYSECSDIVRTTLYTRLTDKGLNCIIHTRAQPLNGARRNQAQIPHVDCRLNCLQVTTVTTKRGHLVVKTPTRNNAGLAFIMRLSGDTSTSLTSCCRLALPSTWQPLPERLLCTWRLKMDTRLL
jgi:hypothetical protein